MSDTELRQAQRAEAKRRNEVVTNAFFTALAGFMTALAILVYLATTGVIK